MAWDRHLLTAFSGTGQSAVVRCAGTGVVGCQFYGAGGFDRTVKVFAHLSQTAAIVDPGWFDLALAFVNGYAARASIFINSAYVDISGGSVGTVDVWLAGQDV